MELNKLQGACPYNGKVSEPHELVKVGKSVVLIVIVVLDKVGVGIFPFGLGRTRHDMTEYLKQKEQDNHENQEHNSVVDRSCKHNIFIVLFVFDRRMLVQVIWNYALLDLNSGLKWQPCHKLDDLHPLQRHSE
jgi:hypothetical protein